MGSLYDLLAFRQEPRKKAGFQLGKVQAGLEPEDWKRFDHVGPGKKEIRIKDSPGIYRVMFVAKFEEAIYGNSGRYMHDAFLAPSPSGRGLG